MITNRLFIIQAKLLEKIAEYGNKEIERDYPLAWEIIHMASCGKIGQLLASGRQIDPELAAIACSVHDYGRIVTGKQANHAQNGYQPLQAFLRECDQFTDEEIEVVVQAAQNHSNKDEIGTKMDELVKDADVLDCYQYGEKMDRPGRHERLLKVLSEFPSASL